MNWEGERDRIKSKLRCFRPVGNPFLGGGNRICRRAKTRKSTSESSKCILLAACWEWPSGDPHLSRHRLHPLFGPSKSWQLQQWWHAKRRQHYPPGGLIKKGEGLVFPFCGLTKRQATCGLHRPETERNAGWEFSSCHYFRSAKPGFPIIRTDMNKEGAIGEDKEFYMNMDEMGTLYDKYLLWWDSHWRKNELLQLTVQARLEILNGNLETYNGHLAFNDYGPLSPLHQLLQQTGYRKNRDSLIGSNAKDLIPPPYAFSIPPVQTTGCCLFCCSPQNGNRGSPFESPVRVDSGCQLVSCVHMFELTGFPGLKGGGALWRRVWGPRGHSQHLLLNNMALLASLVLSWFWPSANSVNLTSRMEFPQVKHLKLWLQLIGSLLRAHDLQQQQQAPINTNNTSTSKTCYGAIMWIYGEIMSENFGRRKRVVEIERGKEERIVGEDMEEGVGKELGRIQEELTGFGFWERRNGLFLARKIDSWTGGSEVATYEEAPKLMSHDWADRILQTAETRRAPFGFGIGVWRPKSLLASGLHLFPPWRIPVSSTWWHVERIQKNSVYTQDSEEENPAVGGVVSWARHKRCIYVGLCIASPHTRDMAKCQVEIQVLCHYYCTDQAKPFSDSPVVKQLVQWTDRGT
nr:hypothetical protein Iba_chr02bCG2090 [Ipomoea batatas]